MSDTLTRVPKIRVPVGSTSGVGELATWQAVSLSLAVTGWAAFRGVGVVVGALLMIPVIYSFARLHNNAPHVQSTSDLVGSVLGPRTASAAGLIQLVAYVLAAAAAAARLGLMVQLLTTGDPDTGMTGLWALLSAIAVVLVGLLTWQLTVRAVAAIGGVLIAVALLVWFYLALAVIARVWSGSAPVDIAGEVPLSGLATVDTVVLLAIAVAGFEICTTANSRLRSAGRPMAIAVAVVAGCAIVIWCADHFGATGGFRFAPTGFAMIVSEFFGESGAVWIIVSSLLGNAAALIVLTSAAARIGRRQLEAVTLQQPPRWGTTLAVAVPAALLAAVTTTGWGSVIPGVWPLLLLTLYLLVAHASSQLPGNGGLSWWIWAFVAGVLAVVVVVPLLDYGTLAAAWPAVIAATLVGLAFAIGWWLTRRPVHA